MITEGISKKIYFRFYDYKKKNTILFLHGFTGNSKIWEPQIKFFTKNYNLLTIDLLGHGKSGTPKKIQGYFFKNQAKGILAILKKLKIKSLSIVSYSYSASIALFISSSVEIKSMVFISPFFFKDKKNFLERQVFKGINVVWAYLVPDKRYELEYSKIKNYEKPTMKDNRYILKSINTKDLLGSVYSFSVSSGPKIKNNIHTLVIFGQNDKYFKQFTEKFGGLEDLKFKKMKGKSHLFLRTKAKEVSKEISIFLRNSLK